MRRNVATQEVAGSAGASAAQAAVLDHAVGYRAVLRLPEDVSALDLSDEELRQWLRSKLRSNRRGTLESADWDGEGDVRLGKSAVVSVTIDDDAHGARRRLTRFVETNDRGTWLISVFALSSRSNGEAVVIEAGMLDVEPERAMRDVAPPRIVKNLLARTIVRDGAAHLTSAPVRVDVDDVAALVAVINDAERRVPVVVATSLSRDTDEVWQRTIADLTTMSVGVAATYVVTDAAAVALAAMLPPSHAVSPGRVRTFVTDVDFALPADGARHRVLGPATFARSIRGGRVALPLQSLHAEGIRKHFLGHELPKDVRRGMRLLIDAESRRIRDARISTIVAERVETTLASDEALETRSVTDTGTTEATVSSSIESPEPGAFSIGLKDRIARFVRHWLGASNLEHDHFDALDSLLAKAAGEKSAYEELFAEAGARETRLADQLLALKERIDELELVAASEAQDALDLRRERDWLRTSMTSEQRAALAIVPDDSAWAGPESVRELVARLTPGDEEHAAFARVQFTGDDAGPLSIDERDPIGRYASALWLYVRVLHDYAEAKAGGWSGNMHMYLTNDDGPMGTRCPRDRHASTESDSVLQNKGWRKERVFTIPDSTGAGAPREMFAHFRPTHRDTFAPRMHYFDDTDRSGKVFIGYIGPHLTNTKTN